MADSFDYDLFVIGGGSGGVRAGRIAATHGAKVALAEEYRMGGTCVIRGCVPKKLMVYASAFPELFEAARGYGWSLDAPAFDWPTFKAAKATELDRLEAAYRRNLGNSGAKIIDGRATIVGPHDVEVDGKRLSAKHILVATGGAPFVPDVPGRDLVLTSNEVFLMDNLPRSMVIVGGGYIACEFACVFAGLGVQVTQVYRGDMVLRGFDDDVRAHVQSHMEAKGISLVLGDDVAEIAAKGDGRVITLKNGAPIDADSVVYATGRVPNTAGLGLKEAGVELDSKGAVVVDSWSQTRVPSIFAVGDVTDRIALTPVAIREGHAFADTVFGGQQRRADHELVASAVFTQPEIGTIGLTEAEARQSHDVEIYKTSFRAMFHAFADIDEKMLMKLVVDKTTDKVLGVHIVGHAAAEMIQMAAIAVKMGATKAQFDATVAVHPTAAEELVTMREPGA